MRNNRIGLMGVLIACAALTWSAAAGAAIEDWNDKNIKWMSYEDGLKEARKSHKPICLIFFTTWCPHCRNYSTVFEDPKVVEKSKSFVMIRLDKDKNAELSGKFKPDGEYIPRTYFLSSDGKLDESVSEPRDQFKYFYNEKDPASILAGMDRALDKLGKAKAGKGAASSKKSKAQ